MSGVACALAGIPPVAAGWLGEKRSRPAPSDRCTALRTACCAPQAAKENGARIFRLAQFLSALGTALALGMLHMQRIPWLPPLVAAPVCVAVCALIWRYEWPTSRSLACVSIYTFLKFALQPNLVVLFKWYKATEENCNPATPIPGLHPLPCFSPEFVGFLDVGAEVAFLVALSFYAAVMSTWRYRTIFAAIQAGLVLDNLLDLFWVCRLNLAIGLPDWLFAFGADVIQVSYTHRDIPG